MTGDQDVKSSSLVRNSFFNVCYQMLNVIFPLVSAAYVARILLPAGMGHVAMAQNWAQYFVVLAALGIPNQGIREISKARIRGSSEVSKVFSELFFINAFATISSCIIYFIVIKYSSLFHDDFSLYIIVGLSIVFNFINVDWFYQGYEQFDFIAVRSFIIKICSLAALLLTVHSQNDYRLYALINVAAVGCNSIWNCIHLPHYGIRLRFNGLQINKQIKPVLLLFLTAAAIQLYTLMNTTLVGLLSSESEVAYFQNSQKIVLIIITVIASISGTLLPRLSAYLEQHYIEKCTSLVNKAFQILLFLFLPMGIGLFLVSDDAIVVLYGSSFIPAINTLRVSAFLIYTLGFSNLFGTQVLLTFGKERQLFLSTLIGSIISIGLCLVLIPQSGAVGASWASVISEGVVTLLCFMFAKKITPIHLNPGFLGKTSIAVVAMTLGVIAVRHLYVQPIARLLLEVFTGIGIYILISFFVKNPTLQAMTNLVRSALGKNRSNEHSQKGE